MWPAVCNSVLTGSIDRDSEAVSDLVRAASASSGGGITPSRYKASSCASVKPPSRWLVAGRPPYRICSNAASSSVSMDDVCDVEAVY